MQHEDSGRHESYASRGLSDEHYTFCIEGIEA